MMRDRDLEHPDITNALLTGYPRGVQEAEDPRCPECGRVCEKLYTRNGEVLGCDRCIEEIEA